MPVIRETELRRATERQATDAAQARRIAGMIDAHRGLIAKVIAVYGRTNLRQREEMEADGLLGLWFAARTWQPDCGTVFTSWACLRIRWAILEGIRERAETRRRNRPRFVSLASVEIENGELADCRGTAPERSVDEADLRQTVLRRAGEDWPIALAILDGEKMGVATRTLGVSQSRTSQRKRMLLDRFAEDRSLMRVLR